MGFISGALDRARNAAASAAGAAAGFASNAAGVVQRVQSASAAGGAAVASAVSGWVSTSFSASNRPPYPETELTKIATDLRHKALEKANSPLLYQKIDILVTALRLGKKDEFASKLEAEKAKLEAKRAGAEVEQKVARDPQGAAAAVPAAAVAQAAQAAPFAVRGSDPLKLIYADVEAIHDLCLSIIQNELPREIQSGLLRIKEEMEKSVNFQSSRVITEIDKLRRIYLGSLCDLPFPGADKFTHCEINSVSLLFGRRPRLLNTGDPSKPQASLLQFFMEARTVELNDQLNVIDRRKELIECLLNNQRSLSDFHKKHLIALILLIDNKYFSLGDRLALIKTALDKGADPSAMEVFWRTPKFINFLFDPKNELRRDLLEMACLQGWNMRCDPPLKPMSKNSSSTDENSNSTAENSGPTEMACKDSSDSADSSSLTQKDSTLLKTMREHFGDRWRQIANQRYREFHQFLEMAIDYGANPLDVVEQATIDKVQQSIAKRNQICSQGSAHDEISALLQRMERERSPHYTADGYVLPANVCGWEFELIQRWNNGKGLYHRAKQEVTARYMEQVNQGIRREEKVEVDLSVADAGGAERTGTYLWPRDLSQLVLDYSGLSKAIALEVQKMRKDPEKIRQIMIAGDSAAAAAAAAGAAAGR